MNSKFSVLLFVAGLAMAWPTISSGAEAERYQPAVPPPTVTNYNGGWGGNGGASTAAGSAMNGMASVISAQGNYNLATSAAAINMTQAQKNEIENRQQWTDTYFQMRATNKAARAAEAGPKPTMEQIARIARDGNPRALRPSQVDPATGRIDWPSALQEPTFEEQRVVVDQLFAKRANQGGLAYSEQTTVRKTIDTMFVELKSIIRDIPPPDYMACRDFLRSLMFTATKNDL